MPYHSMLGLQGKRMPNPRKMGVYQPSWELKICRGISFQVFVKRDTSNVSQ